MKYVHNKTAKYSYKTSTEPATRVQEKALVIMSKCFI